MKLENTTNVQNAVANRFKWNYAHLGALAIAVVLSLTAYAVQLGADSKHAEDLIVANAWGDHSAQTAR